MYCDCGNQIEPEETLEDYNSSVADLLQQERVMGTKEIHVIFTASWCGPCKELKRRMVQKWSADRNIVNRWEKKGPSMVRFSSGQDAAVLVLSDWHEPDLGTYAIELYPTRIVFGPNANEDDFELAADAYDVLDLLPRARP